MILTRRMMLRCLLKSTANASRPALVKPPPRQWPIQQATSGVRRTCSPRAVRRRPEDPDLRHTLPMGQRQQLRAVQLQAVR